MAGRVLAAVPVAAYRSWYCCARSSIARSCTAWPSWYCDCGTSRAVRCIGGTDTWVWCCQGVQPKPEVQVSPTLCSHAVPTVPPGTDSVYAPP
eukprot:2332335-Rhodomonas_salina.1